MKKVEIPLGAPADYIFWRILTSGVVFSKMASSQGEWEEVYNYNEETGPAKFVCDVEPKYNGWDYYQTGGGGPDSGYITDGTVVVEVTRDWMKPWTFKEIKSTLEVRKPDWKRGICAGVCLSTAA